MIEKTDYYHPESLVRPSPAVYMGNSSADQFFPRSPRSHSGFPKIAWTSASRRMPSSMGYLTVAIMLLSGLFVALWWILVKGGDEAPWLPAGLAASVVLLVALSPRSSHAPRMDTLSFRERHQPQAQQVVLAKAVVVRREDFPRQYTQPRYEQFKNNQLPLTFKFNSGSTPRRCANVSRLSCPNRRSDPIG